MANRKEIQIVARAVREMCHISCGLCTWADISKAAIKALDAYRESEFKAGRSKCWVTVKIPKGRRK